MEAVLLSPSGRTVLSSVVVSIGSATDNEVMMNDDKVSPHHAEMHLTEEGYSITDLTSKNGTFVNAQRLASNVAHPLNSSDMIRIGDTHLRYVVADVAQATPTASIGLGQGSSLGHQPTSASAATPTSSIGTDSVAQVAPVPLPIAASSVPSFTEAILLSSSGQTVLSSAGVSIGSAADNQVVVNDAKVSPHHAEIRVVGEGYSISDLASTNGTFVNGQQLASNVPHPLNAGDIIRVGNTPFRYEGSGPPQVASSGSATPSQASSAEYRPTAAVASSSSATTPSSLEQQASIAPIAAVVSSSSATTPSSLEQQAPIAPTAAVASSSSVTTPSSLEQQASIAPIAFPSSKVPAQPQKKSGRIVRIVLGIAAILVIILAIIYGVITFVGGSTPTQTLNTFCGSLKSGDFDMAYSQLSGPRQMKITETNFMRLFSSVTSCTFSSVKKSDDSHATATITFLGTTGGPASAPTDLVLEEETWKIDAINI